MITLVHGLWGLVFASFISRWRAERSLRSPNIPVLIALGMAPDMDLLTSRIGIPLFEHHALLHSWPAITAAYIPLMIVWRWQSLPYFVATIQHVLFGDLLSNRIPFFLPDASKQIGIELFANSFYANLLLETIPLPLSLFIVLKMRLRHELGKSRDWTLLSLFSTPFLYLTLINIATALQPSQSLESKIYAALAGGSILIFLSILLLGISGLRGKLKGQ